MKTILRLEGNNWFFSLWTEAEDIQRYKGRWPCSGLKLTDRIRFEYDKEGQLTSLLFNKGSVPRRVDVLALEAMSCDAYEQRMTELEVARKVAEATR